MKFQHNGAEPAQVGVAQKVQFITTVLHEPRLLIFDEPFSGFDPINVNLLKQEILKMKEDGATIIFSTHNMSSVEELCDHITGLNLVSFFNQQNSIYGQQISRHPQWPRQARCLSVFVFD